MGIFKGSRYTNTSMSLRDTTLSFNPRTREDFSNKGAFTYMFKDGDSLDKLAYEYYGNPRLWWAILEANPRFKLEAEIKPGDRILIPAYEEVRKYE